MSGDPLSNLAATSGFTDLHNHLMPGVDDGAASVEEARSGLLALRDAGVRRVATTPHVDASLLLRRSWEKRAAALDAAWERLCAVGAETAPEMDLVRAAEVRLDVPEPDLSDPRVRYGGGASLLVEFAYFTVPPYSDRMIARIIQGGMLPVIAHPERYRGLSSDRSVVQVWQSLGAAVQVNAGSFTGRYGSEPRANAQALLTAGCIDCIASDYHSRGVPELNAAREWLESVGAQGQAELLFDVNPARLVAGEQPLPVPPLDVRPGLWSRLWGVVRRR